MTLTQPAWGIGLATLTDTDQVLDVWFPGASLGLGALMKAFLGDNPMNAVLLGGCSMIVAAICVSFVSKDVDSHSEALSGETSERAALHVQELRA